MVAKRSDARNQELHEPFWDAVEPLLGQPGVDEGTLMGFPCVRVGGEFFAMPRHDSGDLVIKVSKARVAELIAAGTGQPFGPGKKVFKEWVLVDKTQMASWPGLLDEAKAFNTPG